MAKEKTPAYDPLAMLLGGGDKPDPEQKAAPDKAGAKSEDAAEKKAEPAPKAKAPAVKRDAAGKTRAKTEARKKTKSTKDTAAGSATQYRQKRDKRLQVVMTQSLYDRLQEEKERSGAKSVNEIVNVLLEQGLKKRG